LNKITKYDPKTRKHVPGENFEQYHEHISNEFRRTAKKVACV
jgi:hypothetical protein